MAGRTRYKKTGDKATILGQWVPNGSHPSCLDLSQSVCLDRTNQGPPYKSGGSLYIAEAHYNWTPSSFFRFDNSLWGRYHGKLIPSGVTPTGYWGGGCPPIPGQSGFPSTNGGNWINGNMDPLEAQGATGWNRAKPTKPIVNFGETIGELHQVPSIPGRSGLQALSSHTHSLQKRVSFAKAAGDEYLNAQFGWKPLLSDLAHLLKIREDVSKRLNQLRRDNGKPVRRRVTLVNIDERTVTESTVSNPFYPYLHPFYHVNGSGKNVSLVEKTRKDWFEAKFRYFIPELAEPGFPVITAARLLGLNPSPSLAWELTPWSWLIDYFANVGDVLSNLADNAVDNLVADYAYVMSSVGYETTFTQTGRVITDSSSEEQFVTATLHHGYSLKRRSFASPFGFGLKPGDLSGSQAAILGALGLSRHW